MRILVTGAAGYLGSILVPRLLQAGHAVLAVDNFMYRQVPLLDCCDAPQLEIRRGDARDPDLLRDCVARADAIVPLACLTGAPACSRDPVGARSVIVDAVRELLRQRGPRQPILYPTTNSGYGIGAPGTPCTEESPLRPVSLYGRLKVEVEQELLDAGHALTLRLATLFGASPRMRTDLLVNDFVQRAVHDRAIVLFEADFRRNYLHVRDAADCLVHCLEHFDRLQGRAYNVGLSDANLSKRELCREIQRQIPDLQVIESAIGRDPDRRDYVVSNARIEAGGFRPRRDLQQGIAELRQAYAILAKHPHGNV